ncbi:MAG: lipopolysaccharide kinase InaA family protein [Sulfurimonas sp.]|nr:lipopolysaccharide kinase InaA family protein [Sulfurimonas sp.]
MSFTHILNPKYTNFKDSLLNIKEIFKTSDDSIHKARNELKIIEINGIKCVVKSFKIPHIINRIAYTYFRDGKAKKSYLNAIELIQRGVQTPEPIGIIEFFEFGLLKESYYISIYEPYDFTIREVFHHKVEDVNEVLKQFAFFTYSIHQKGVWHVDYSLGNILITKEKDAFRFSLVDINRMEFKTIKDYEGLKNLNKFWAKNDEDLPYLAKEYAKCASLDEEKAIKTAVDTANELEKKTNLKRKLKGQY